MFFGGVETGRNRQMPARMLPMTEWKVAEMAQGSAARGICAKCCFASAAPKPEFCMPTSMEMVRLVSSSQRSRRLRRVPEQETAGVEHKHGKDQFEAGAFEISRAAANDAGANQGDHQHRDEG